jgi:5-methylcytosine-specific restriction protein A
MKLCNFLALDPDYGKKGLPRISNADRTVWGVFAKDRASLKRLANAIRTGARQFISTDNAAAAGAAVDEEEEFPEGRLLTRLHKIRERNPGLVEKTKKIAMQKHGRLSCEVCGFDFSERYGSLGENFIEAHHVVAVSVAQVSKPKISEMALVCSNCHRMLHRRRPWPTLDDLRAVLRV